jgi:hypothetical protein
MFRVNFTTSTYCSHLLLRVFKHLRDSISPVLMFSLYLLELQLDFSKFSKIQLQKLPDDFEKILLDAFLWQACIIHDHAIPAALQVNTDQTQTHYQMGGKKTWNKTGEKQVSTMGIDER